MWNHYYTNYLKHSTKISVLTSPLLHWSHSSNILAPLFRSNTAVTSDSCCAARIYRLPYTVYHILYCWLYIHGWVEVASYWKAESNLTITTTDALKFSLHNNFVMLDSNFFPCGCNISIFAFWKRNHSKCCTSFKGLLPCVISRTEIVACVARTA
jgi:hypothetical protein